jgi:hypothetical protein
MANRTRIPTAIKELRGNPSKKRLNKAEPKPTLAARRRRRRPSIWTPSPPPNGSAWPGHFG